MTNTIIEKQGRAVLPVTSNREEITCPVFYKFFKISWLATSIGDSRSTWCSSKYASTSIKIALSAYSSKRY